MIYNYQKHLIESGKPIKEGLQRLNDLAADAILFVICNEGKLKGSITDGDVRRGLLRGLNMENRVDDFIQENPKFIRKGNYTIHELIEYRTKNFKVIPVIDQEDKIVNIINFRSMSSYLPVDAVIMAGGRGQRLWPLTEKIPKPMLKVGEKPIIEHNIDRLSVYGIDDFWISLKYLGEQIEAYFETGKSKNINIQYVWEDASLGTIGAVSKIKNFNHEYVLVTNSDLLTNLDYEDFFLDFLKHGADLAIVTIPYIVNVPYAVLETDNKQILSFKEKPSYTYYSNGGIYLMRKEVLNYLPSETFFDATDLLEVLLREGKKVVSYPLSGYWLDIGRHEDYKKAQEDINFIKF